MSRIYIYVSILYIFTLFYNPQNRFSRASLNLSRDSRLFIAPTRSQSPHASIPALYEPYIYALLLTTGMRGWRISLFGFTAASQSVAKRTASPRIVQRYVFQHELAQRSRHSGATTFSVVCDGNAQQTSNTPPNTQAVRSVSKGPLSTSISCPLSSYLHYPKPLYSPIR